MKNNEKVIENIKVTSEDTNANDKFISSTGMKRISTGTGVLYKPLNEIAPEINPNNGAAFEERSNPLSSKGN